MSCRGTTTDTLQLSCGAQASLELEFFRELQANQYRLGENLRQLVVEH